MRSAAEGAGAGFPGDLAGAFSAVNAAFSDWDGEIRRKVNDAAQALGAAGTTYRGTDEQNAADVQRAGR